MLSVIRFVLNVAVLLLAVACVYLSTEPQPETTLTTLAFFATAWFLVTVLHSIFYLLSTQDQELAAIALALLAVTIVLTFTGYESGDAQGTGGTSALSVAAFLAFVLTGAATQVLTLVRLPRAAKEGNAA